MSEAAIDVGVERGDLRQRVRNTLTRLSRTGSLPTLPAAASAALNIARDPEADVQHVCEVIHTDVGLAARIIRAANSAAIGRRTPAKSLRALERQSRPKRGSCALANNSPDLPTF